MPILSSGNLLLGWWGLVAWIWKIMNTLPRERRFPPAFERAGSFQVLNMSTLISTFGYIPSQSDAVHFSQATLGPPG